MQNRLLGRITPELKRAFLEMPTTVEDLQAAIQDTISEANSILFLNANVLEEYESRQRNGSWLPKLRNLVTRINETFSFNFQEMAVAGEVSLDEHDMDFDQYGILIKVKFSSLYRFFFLFDLLFRFNFYLVSTTINMQTGQLEVLSAHHQSGGDITNCPFRVVDEKINQGMDPINERKMFQQLVRAASQPNTPQCFLLTPKLLPNLEYSDACSIMNVMKGPWIESPSKVWSSSESRGSVRGVPMQDNRC